jgi:secreted trypsin-like serine protease
LQDKGEKVVKKALESHIIFQNDHSAANDSAKGEVSEFIIHPDWDPKEKHYTADIAIAVLKKPMKLSKEIHHVCWNTPSHPIQGFAGKKGLVYGWGLTEEFKTVSELRQVRIPLVDQSECKEANRAFRGIMSSTSFCAGARDGKSGACNG